MTDVETTFSVVIPAHGAGDELLAAVDSALGQTFEPAEVVVVDDGNNSRECIAALAARPAVKVVASPRRGAAPARNTGIRVARGIWVAFLDADDRWLDDHLASVAEQIAQDPTAGVCFSAAIHVNDFGDVLNFVPARSRWTNLSGLLRRRIQPTTSATVARRDAVMAIGGFYEGFLRPAGVEDIDLWWRIARRYRCLAQPRASVVYQVHEERDRARTHRELLELACDRRRCVERLAEGVPPRLFRLAAAQHDAIMARYWLVAGFRREGARASARSLRWAPTLNGLAALIVAMLPPLLAQRARRARRRVLTLGGRRS